MFYKPYESMDTGARVDAMQAKSASRRAALKVDLLRDDVERLLMIVEALWSIVREQHDCTDDELLRRVTQIDMQDGRLDGRVAPTEAPACPSCGRTMAKNRPRCLYCGHMTRTDLFQR